jgi:hypothetical protein
MTVIQGEKCYCPILKKEIDVDYCYEITLVTIEVAKPSFLFDDIGDRNEAFKVCESCKNIQL